MARDLETDDVPVAIVRVDREIAVPADSLRFAQERAAEVFRRIGVRVRWIDTETAVREHLAVPFTLVLVNAEHNAGVPPKIEDALGLAVPGVHRAYVFYDRIDALRVGSPATIANVLGDVMAHELGHLMLTPPAHTADGIMRPGVHREIRALETFNISQAREILLRLREAPGSKSF